MTNSEGKFWFVKLSRVFALTCMCRVEVYVCYFCTYLRELVYCTFCKSVQLAVISDHRCNQWDAITSWCLIILIGMHAFYHLLSYFFNYRNHFSFRFRYNSFLQLGKGWVWFSQQYINLCIVWWTLVWTRGLENYSWFRVALVILGGSFNQSFSQKPMIIIFGLLIVCGQLLFPVWACVSVWLGVLIYLLII